MRLKIGDNVKVISGNDKGKFGKITNLMKPFVTVEGINIRTKHVKPATREKSGEIVPVSYTHLTLPTILRV